MWVSIYVMVPALSDLRASQLCANVFPIVPLISFKFRSIDRQRPNLNLVVFAGESGGLEGEKRVLIEICGFLTSRKSSGWIVNINY